MAVVESVNSVRASVRGTYTSGDSIKTRTIDLGAQLNPNAENLNTKLLAVSEALIPCLDLNFTGLRKTTVTTITNEND